MFPLEGVGAKDLYWTSENHLRCPKVSDTKIKQNEKGFMTHFIYFP
jgi:hypothetical protein